MEEIQNITLKEVQKLIKNFPIKPHRNNMVITVNVEEADGDLVLTNGQFSETQYLIAAGNFHINRENDAFFKAGDKILLDLEKMMVFDPVDENSHERIGRIKIKPIQVDDTMFAIISDSYILAKDER